jgi:pimeloyl-ACP methyl ester carboxylesterase/nucleotide-binding universal stress UspA family protein
MDAHDVSASSDEDQKVRLAAAGNGTPLAFTSTGTGGLAVLSPLCLGSTMQGIVRSGAQRPFLGALGAGYQLVLYDQRGAGASAAAGGPASWEQRAEDLWAVADAAGVERAVLYGVFDAGHTIARAAALHPKRVLGLIFNCVPVCFVDDAPGSGGVAAADLGRWFQNPRGTRAGIAALLDALGIGEGDTAMLAEEWERPANAQSMAAHEALLRSADLRPLLPRLEMPALVAAPARRRLLGGWAEALAALLPHARPVRPENGGEALGAMHAFLAVLAAGAGRQASKVPLELSAALGDSRRAVGALRRILVPVDPNVASGRAVELACRLGAEQQAQIMLVHVVCVPHALPLDHPLAEARRRGERALALGAAIVAEHGLRSAERLVVGRSVAGPMVALADEVRADLIVMAAVQQAPGEQGRISRTVQEVMRRATCEVIVDEAGTVAETGTPAAERTAAGRAEALAEVAP